MLKQNIDNNELNRIQNFNFFSGRAQALEQVEDILRKMSGDSYINQEDIKAQLLRELSIKFAKLALEERKKMKDYQPKFTGGV